MAGYRQHSFDPNAYDAPGPLIRPFNWAQWTGVGFVVIGFALVTLYLLAKMGVGPAWAGKPSIAPFMLMMIGTTIVNSRRHPGAPIDDEQRARNRKLLLITVLVCAIILGTVAAIELGGVSS